MRVMLLTESPGPAQLFDLVVQHAVTSVLDLRSSGTAPHLLQGIYHRPARVMAPQTMRRLVQAGGDQVILVLVERAKLEQVRADLQLCDAKLHLEIGAETEPMR